MSAAGQPGSLRAKNRELNDKGHCFVLGTIGLRFFFFFLECKFYFLAGGLIEALIDSLV